MSSKMVTSTGYWRFVKMDRSKKYEAPYMCYSIENFTITDYLGSNSIPLVFEFVNGAWQTWFIHKYQLRFPNTYYYNDQEVQHENIIRIKDDDSLRVKYKNFRLRSGADVTFYYKEDTLYWNVEEAIKIKEEKWKAEVDWLQRQNQETAVQLKSANKSIDQCKELEGELRKQIADLQLQQHNLHEQLGQLAKSVERWQQVAAEQELTNKTNLEEFRKYKEVEAELRKQIADLQLLQQMQEERCQLAKSMKELQEVAAKQESTNNANLEEIRKHKEVEAELRIKIADLQGDLQLQQETKERGENQQLPHSRTIDVIRQPSLQFPAILQQIKQNSTQIVEEMASIWERERSEMNDKIAKLAQQLKENQDRELPRTQQAMSAMTMLNQTLLEGYEESVKAKEANESIVSQSDINVDKNCATCETELGEVSVLEGFHRYCHQCLRPSQSACWYITCAVWLLSTLTICAIFYCS